MRILLIHVCAALVACGCASRPLLNGAFTDAEWDDHRVTYNYYLDEDGEEVPHGLSTMYHKNGRRECLTRWRHGKKDGEQPWWDEKGNRSILRLYRNGDMLQDTFYYLTGLKSMVVRWRESKTTVEEWHENGHRSFKGNYLHKQEQGKHIRWNEDGTVAWVRYFEDGTELK